MKFWQFLISALFSVQNIGTVIRKSSLYPCIPYAVFLISVLPPTLKHRHKFGIQDSVLYNRAFLISVCDCTTGDFSLINIVFINCELASMMLALGSSSASPGKVVGLKEVNNGWSLTRCSIVLNCKSFSKR